jgi:lipoyl-dependent peroxiredoxin
MSAKPIAANESAAFPLAAVEQATWSPSTATVAMTTRGVLHTRAVGRVVSDDGALALVVRSRSHAPDDAIGATAEQLLAAGLAAGFHDALGLAAQTMGIRLVGSVDIVVTVRIDSDPLAAGMCLSAELEVSLPPLDRDDERSLMLEAERLCPFAKLTRSGIRSSFILR